MTFNKNSNFSYVGLGNASQVFSEDAIGEGVPFSKIQFPTDVTPGSKVIWKDHKYVVVTDSETVTKTKEEILTMPNFKSNVTITPLIEYKTMTYKVEFIIKDGGEFTIFQGNEVQEFTEEIAGKGIPFSKVEFPGAGDINATPYVWDGVTFSYNGKITTAERLKAEEKTFNDNIILMLMTEIGEYKVTFFRMDGVYYDRVNHDLEYLVEYPEFKFTENLPRVDLGLEESTKYMDRLYRYTNKWDIYKNDNSTNWYTNNFFKTMTSDEFKHYKIDNELGIYPNLEKKDIDVVFEEGGTDYTYPAELEKHQKLQVEKIGDKAISIGKIKFPATVITAEGVTIWKDNKWILKIGDAIEEVIGTKEELVSKTFTDTVHLKPLIKHLPPPGVNLADFTELVTDRDNKKYYVRPADKENWSKSIEVYAVTEADRETVIKVKRIHVKDIYTTLVFDEEHYRKYHIKPEDVPKWNNFEKVYGITQYNMDNLFWDDSVIQQYRKLHMNEKFIYEIEQNGKKYYLRTSDDLMSYYDFITVKAWKGVIDDYLDENAYENIKRPDWTPPVKSDTPVTPGKAKVTFWGGPNCDFTDMTNPNTIELTEDQPEGASLENLTFPHIKFKSFIRTDIGYGLKEGEWKITYLLNGKWKTVQRITNSIKKMIIKGNVLIQPNPGKQR